jgi:flagellar assembly protein FliH
MEQMNMSSSKAALTNAFHQPVSGFQYRQLVIPTAPIPAAEEEEIPQEPSVTMTEEAFRSHVAAERAAAASEMETRLRQEYEQKAARESRKISEAIRNFEEARKQYFSRVEAEVVQLALSISAKILHRESQVDPLLVTALVQIALGQLKEGSAATIRVRPEEAGRWRDHFATLPLKLSIVITEDASLEPGDCLLDTEMGTVNFGLDVQLKEVEKGFFDVLAQRPQV